MQEWLRISLNLCAFGFFRDMRPSEPFVAEFLSSDWRNLTAETVNKEIYPLGTYSYASQLVIVFLITDILRYKPIIIISAICGLILHSILVWDNTILGLKIGQIFFGTYMAAEVAYYTYIYAKVDRNKYQLVTGHSRSAILAGRFLASVLAQILISTELMNPQELNFITVGSQFISFFLAVSLPHVPTSLYFYTQRSSIINNTEVELNNKTTNIINEGNNSNQTAEESGKEKKISKGKFSWQNAMQLMWKHFLSAYSQSSVVLWSIWFALASGGFYLVLSYIQFLWHHINNNQQTSYNGAVEAMHTLISAGGAFGAGFLDNVKYEKWELVILSACSLLEGLLLVWAALTNSIWVAYITYIAFGTLFQFTITIASATIAKKLDQDSFGLIFGINNLASLIIQSILTVVIISDDGFSFSITGQFLSFGIFFILLGLTYIIYGIVERIRKMCTTKIIVIT